MKSDQLMKDKKKRNPFIIPSLLFLLLFVPAMSTAQNTYNSVQDGMWGASSTWDQNNDPGCTVNSDIVISDTVTCSCNPLDIQGSGSITIKSGGHLEVTSSTGITGDGDLTVESGGSLEVQGDLDLSGNSNFTVDGEATVEGDLTASGNTTADGSGTLTLGGTGCSNWSGSGTCSQGVPLPVQLLFFEAEADGDRIALRWRTATEKNNRSFRVQRSTDGENFTTIEQVEGAGTSTTPNSYKAYDPNPKVGVSYYRLKQVDFDGESEVSEPVAVRHAGDKDSLKVYPNPTTHSQGLRLRLNGFQGEVLVVLRDVHGKKYHSKLIPTEKNGSVISAIDLNEQIPSGIYMVVASSNDAMYRKKVVIE